MNSIRQFLISIKKSGVRRPEHVKTVAMGREREFCAWDLGEDTFIFEDGIANHLEERPSVLIVDKRDLGNKKSRGFVMTMTTGNHSVAAFPLLDGRFWKLSRLKGDKRSDALMHSIICSNVANATIETSQRDVPSRKLYIADDWLVNKIGFSLADIVMGDRNEITLEHYRQLGQEWRVKPLAWTENEMKIALAAAKKRIASKLQYYHSSRGVHFLSFAEFCRFATLAEDNPNEFLLGLRELVSVFEGNRTSFTRMLKYRGHHEIEFFGINRGVAVEKLVPEIEKLMESVVLGRLGHLGIIQRTQEICELFESLLTRPELKDDTSPEFIRALYMHITGEIYSIVGEGATPAFDDRRTALPGGTFVEGRPVMHPGSDTRSEILLSNLRGLMSSGELVEYANVYELHDNDSENTPIGKGKTREIVYKTNRGPLEHSLIEKRLSKPKRDYGSYMLARVEVFKSLGVGLSEYRLLKRRINKGKRSVEYYIRKRCPGEPLEAIPKNYFCNAGDVTQEDREVVLGLASLMGDAAAQNMAMKKYDHATKSSLFGIGKEIYEFEYDFVSERVIPKSVSTCSIRGTFGWPNLEYTDDNLHAMASFYLESYAQTLKKFQREHSVPMAELAERFLSGFEYRTQAMSWQLSVMRDRFEMFKPKLASNYGFDKKWNFAMWSLERQQRRLPIARKMFLHRVENIENESLRNNS